MPALRIFFLKDLSIARTPSHYRSFAGYDLPSLAFVTKAFSPYQFPICRAITANSSLQQSRSPLKTIRTLRDPNATLAKVAVKPRDF